MSNRERRDYWEAMKRYRRTFTQSISQRIQIQDKNYYWEAIKKHRRTVALLIAATITFPLFVFTALPPVEVVEEIPEEVVLPTETPTTVLINDTVIVNTTIEVNTSEGGSFYLEPQPAPPLIDTDIVFCIDTSGSMDINRMPLAKRAINKTLELINQSYWSDLSNDRIGLVSFDANTGDWTTDATVHAGLDFVSNQTHLNQILNNVNSFVGGGGTDAWAGLNFSLDLILNNPRNTSVLKTIIFLTDGKHNTGPWGTDVDNGNYTGFMQLPSDELPDSESPVVVARESNVRIYSIGLFEGASFEFDDNFLRNISLDPVYGTFGDFFVGNDTLSITESFLKARDSASGWTPVIMNETTIIGTGSEELFSFNVTKNVRRLKWDLNWEDKSIDFNLSVIHPNGTIITITYDIIENIIPFIEQQPKTVYIDFPESGIWQFNISWRNILTDETILSRLSSYDPPIFVESVTQINESVLTKIQPFYYIAELGNDDIFESQSILFTINVTNKNPLFTFHNITPTILTDLTVFSDNVSYYWDPPIALQLETGKTTSFLFNLTLDEPMLIDGTVQFKVNCSEGYYDAYAQPLYLDYRINTRNISQTTTTYELRNQTTIMLGTTNVMKYTYDRELFDTAKWIGLIATFAILLSFLAIYIQSQQSRLKDLAFRFRSRLFPDQSALEQALQREGISVTPADVSTIMAEAGDLDRLGESVYKLTGRQLSTEELLRVASGTDIDKIAQRISAITEISVEEALTQLREAQSIDDLIQELNLDSERFLDIIARDEDVLDFQTRIKGLMVPQDRVISGIKSNENLDIDKFRSRLKNTFRPR